MKSHSDYEKKFSLLIEAIETARVNKALLLIEKRSTLGDTEDEVRESLKRIRRARVQVEFTGDAVR